MQRERWNTAAAPRDRPVGVAVGTSVGRAVASEENCARFNESQGVDKEPVPLTSGMTHEYTSDFPPEDHVRFRRERNRRVLSVYERGNALPCLCFAPNHPRSDGYEALRREYHRLRPGRAKKRRRRVIVDSDSDSDDEEQGQGSGAGVGASLRAVLTAGRLAASGGAGDRGGASRVGGSAGDGPDGERHQAAVAEARRHLGGGGKRGWLA